MEYLARLVGGANSFPANKQTTNSSEQRLIRFKKVHDQLQQIWRKYTSAKVSIPPEPVIHCLQDIKRILQDEARIPAPHLCARHVSTFHIYTTLAQLASTYNNGAIVHDTLDIFKILLDGEEDFLGIKSFADALTGFVGAVSATGQLLVSVETEARMAEVLFDVAAKLRIQPNLLSIWFRPNSKPLGTSAEDDEDMYSPATEFPLFYFTLDYVHHDGEVGDFARTTLLYLIELAAHSEALEWWIIESDLATLMASGLGALYSQLSRKLVLSFSKDSIPEILSFSESSRPQTPPDAEKTTSPDFQAHLATFLSYLVFWQDVLEHCSSSDVKQTLLDHFKLLFLQQLLYPSLVESSDIDGGSSVAVLTYLKCIIESVDNPDLIRLILEYLLAIPEKRALNEESPSRPTALAQRRKSQTLIVNLAREEEKPSPNLFTLVDLVLASLRSRNQQTVTATLRLTSVLVGTHHGYTNISLIKTKPYDCSLRVRTLRAHDQDTATFFSMVEDLISHDHLSEAYEAHIHDAQILLESHCCSAHLLGLPNSEPASKVKARFLRPHLIAPEDPLSQSITALLEDFLTNDFETNLSLTQTFSTLASCGNTRLDFWLLRDSVEQTPTLRKDTTKGDDLLTPDHDDSTRLDNQDDERSKAESEPTFAEHRTPHSQAQDIVSTVSPLFSALNSLVHRVEALRQEFQNFDTYLAERRHVFKVGEDIDNAVTNNIPLFRTSEDSTSTAPLAPKYVAKFGSISARLMSQESSTTVSRSSSPRGRQPKHLSTATLVSRLGHLRISPSRSPVIEASRALSPSPIWKGSISSTPPKRLVTPMGPADALRQKIRIKAKARNDRRHIRDMESSETSSVRSESMALEPAPPEQFKEVSLSHLLTNIVILQEFILELAAIVEIRASLFGDVNFV